jgi:hypothetical protein
VTVSLQAPSEEARTDGPLRAANHPYSAERTKLGVCFAGAALHRFGRMAGFRHAHIFFSNGG